jgi:uncharacterized membrane protein
MSWLTLLYYVNYAITVVTGVAVLFAVAPAYKRTRHRAFLYLTFAFMLRLFDIVCDYTIGRFRMPHGEHVAYRTLRMFASFATVILLTVGIIMLTRSYLASSQSKSDATPNV